MLNFNSVIVLSKNPTVLVEFYKKIVGKETDWSGGDYVGFKVGGGFMVIGPDHNLPDRNPNPNRVMLNFEADDVKKEFERIKELGATVVKDPYAPSEEKESDMLVATLADPDGNYFQLVSPMKDM